MNVIVQYDPFAPVAELERKVEALESVNAALLADQTALCDLLAQKCQRIALLEQENARLKQRGVYKFSQPQCNTGRYRVGGQR